MTTDERSPMDPSAILIEMKSRCAPPLIIAALLLVIIACWLPFCLKDWREGDGICPVHGIAMETIYIHPAAGPAPSFAPGYYDAREKHFPNAPPDIVSGVWWRAAMIYVCPECARARKAWRP